MPLPLKQQHASEDLRNSDLASGAILQSPQHADVGLTRRLTKHDRCSQWWSDDHHCVMTSSISMLPDPQGCLKIALLNSQGSGLDAFRGNPARPDVSSGPAEGMRSGGKETFRANLPRPRGR